MACQSERYETAIASSLSANSYLAVVARLARSREYRTSGFRRKISQYSNVSDEHSQLNAVWNCTPDSLPPYPA